MINMSVSQALARAMCLGQNFRNIFAVDLQEIRCTVDGRYFVDKWLPIIKLSLFGSENKFYWFNEYEFTYMTGIRTSAYNLRKKCERHLKQIDTRLPCTFIL